MVDPADAIGRARAAVAQRAELPGMSLMEHLDELRKRIVRSFIYLVVGFLASWAFHDKFVGLIQAPLNHIGKTLVFTHPMDPLNLDLQVSLVGGSDSGLALHPLPGVALHCAGALPERAAVCGSLHGGHGGAVSGRRGLRLLLCAARRAQILIVDFGHNFTSMVTIEEYSSFFLSIILGLGISFEMPILIFFLAMFGIVSPRFLWKNIRYAILAVFIVAAVICPSPDPWTMCIYAIPMLALYLIGIGVAWWVHPSRRKAKEAAKL